MRHEHGGPTTPSWVERMTPGRWYRISGDRPDLDLGATPTGTRYLADNDPAKDVRLNPARGPKEILRRFLGRRLHARWEGRVGFPAITRRGMGRSLRRDLVRVAR